MKIVPKLYLNMSPQTAEDGSLAFARNMKLDNDGNLVSDYGFTNLFETLAGEAIIGHIIGLDNKIYFFTNNSRILEYDEITKGEPVVINSSWQWSGGKITGCVNTNISGEKILTIGEYHDEQKIPLKHINLSYPLTPSESLYTQAPVVPILNLNLDGTYSKTIPNGVYVFFVRYKIRKDVYTNWYLCSNPVFAGSSEQTVTIQGGLKYLNLHKDSSKSFAFKVNVINDTACSYYSEFQLGFIITHDEATDARIWKSFSTDIIDGDNTIYFDYENVQETNIDELLETTYEIYNVKNITAFKNKLYISNYIESDINVNLDDISDTIVLDTSIIDNSGNYNPYNKITLNIASTKYSLCDFDTARDFYVNLEYGSNKTSINNRFSTYFSGLLNSKAAKFDNLFNSSISNFYKGDVVESEKVLSFTLYGNVDPDPDIVYYHIMRNKLYDNAVFGADFNVKYNSTGTGWEDIGLMASTTEVSGLYKMSTAWYSASFRHPLHSKGLDYAYGLFTRLYPEHIDSMQGDPVNGDIICFNNNTVDDSPTRGTAYAASRFFDERLRTDIESLVKKNIESNSKFVIGYAIITDGAKTYKVSLSSNVTKDIFELTNYFGVGNGDRFDVNLVNDSNNELIANRIKSELGHMFMSKTQGIDNFGNIVLLLDGDYVTVSAVTFVFKLCELKCSNGTQSGTNDNEHYNVIFDVNLKATTYSCVCNFSFKNNIISILDPDTTNDIYKQASTLMPGSTYNFYVHLVDSHNIITNGILAETLTIPLDHPNDTFKHILNYRIHNTDLYNLGYKAFFVSLKPVGDIIIECFGHSYINGMNIVNVLEADALLYNINDNIKIINSNGTTITSDAVYYPSGKSNPSLAFGNCGFVGWYGDEVTGQVYIKIHRDIQEDKDTPLIKATPYISLENSTNKTNITNGFYGSYFCSVKKPSLKLSSSCYVSGNDVYSAERGTVITLTDFKEYVTLRDSLLYLVRSNFNLNYLSLTEDINDRVYRVGNTGSDIKQVIKTINSATLSSIYELKSMYKDFMNKTFKEYSDDDYKVDFDNTIRVSNLLSDETFNNSVFNFRSTDYYNIPADRGIIVKLFSIANNIYVHTKHSFYKFDGNSTIIASDKDINLQESEPFNVGVTQLVDSEYGYGGIDNKEAGCVTFDSYFFYDEISNHIFAYTGNQQIQLIDASIHKFLDFYKPTHCVTLHDEINNRVFFEFTSSRKVLKDNFSTFTLSYNYKSKSFISFHDLTLNRAFFSGNKCYSYNPNRIQIVGSKEKVFELFTQTEDINDSPFIVGSGIYNIYGNATTACIAQFGTSIYKTDVTQFSISIVIKPEQNLRETVNSVKYISDIIQNNIEEIKEISHLHSLNFRNYDLMSFPQTTRINPVKSFYIVTDRCISSVINTNVNDEARPNSLLDYKGFKYDMGFWTGNYFRNAINKEDVYEYNREDLYGGLNTDNQSLVYGRYFIFNFYFKNDKPIKFEEIFINSEKY